MKDTDFAPLDGCRCNVCHVLRLNDGRRATVQRVAEARERGPIQPETQAWEDLLTVVGWHR